MKHKNNCLLLLIGALIVIVIFSPLTGLCASSEPSLKKPLGVQKKASAAQGTASIRIDTIAVSDVTNACRVTITAAKMPAYTVYKLAAPDRIIVDIPGLMVDQKSSVPVQLQNNLISGIKANTIDKNGTSTAHIEITLKHAALYDASQRETSLFIDISKAQPVAGQKIPDTREPQVNKQQGTASASPVAKKSAAAQEIPPKISIKDISIIDSPSGYQVVIAADAEIRNYHPFTLQKPARLAIDIPAATSSVSRSAQNIKNSLIKNIRIGSANDKVRFVIDFATPSLPKYQIDQKGHDLLVMLETPRKASARKSVAENSAPARMTASSTLPTEQKVSTEKDKGASKRACSKNNTTPAVSPAGQIAQKKNTGPDQSATAPEPLPAATADTSGGVPQSSGQKISLDFKDADIKNILRLISEVSGFNIITSDRVAGKVTLKMENIPWDQALDIILESNNLGKIVTGNIIRIDTKDQILKSQKDKLEQTSLEDLMMETVPVSYVKARDIEKYIKDLKVLTDKRGSINAFEHTNTITITDVPDKVKRIKLLIQEQDIPTRQVLIEARIVQSNPSYAKELGIVWGNLYNTTKDGGKTKGGADIALSGAAGGGSVVNLPAAVGLGSGGGINFGYVTNSLQLDIQLTALEKDEKLKIVSSPKILGIDNKEARIKQGVALPYLKLSEQGVTSTEFKDAVLELKVTPKITPANTVSLHVFVTKNQKSAQTGAGGEPGIDIREVETDLLIDNGKTVVIGGIYETTKDKIVNKVPFFGNLPFLGYFFRNTRVEDQLTEILVFLTVSIVYQPQIAGQASAEK
jgi:type IV pilus secretin PilQ/predicted competence protein